MSKLNLYTLTYRLLLFTSNTYKSNVNPWLEPPPNINIFPSEWLTAAALLNPFLNLVSIIFHLFSLTEYLSIVLSLSLPSKPPKTYICSLLTVAAAKAHLAFYKGSMIFHSFVSNEYL